jgi:proteasome activator subunit 4
LLLELPDSGDDPELQGLSRTALALAARLQLEPALVDQVLNLFRTASSDGSWHYRIRLLGFVQVFIFRNLFAANGEVVLQLLLELMQDEHVEVRLAAAVPLAGAIQCGIITMSSTLLGRFTSMLPALPKHGRRKKSKVEDDDKTVACKHAAVLGLKALLLAHPYSFPDWMPELLMVIGSRINEREPIK